MPNIEWAKVMTLAVASGLVAGVVNQLAGILRDWLTRHWQAKQDEQTRDFASVAQLTELQHKTDMQNRELAHEQKMLAEKREHADLERQDTTHSKVQNEYLPLMADFLHWCESVAITQGLAIDLSYVAATISEPTYVKTPIDAIDLLRRIGYLHPTRFVREAAYKLCGKVDATYNMDPGDGSNVGEPTLEEIRQWLQWGSAILEGMHDPRPVAPLVK